MFRFAPRESQKESAELTHQLAVRVYQEGTHPRSPVAAQLEKGTRATTLYMGTPKNPPDPQRFDATTQQAELDARDRPDPWQVADSAFEVAIGVAALFTGVGGVKAASYLRDARAKSNALQEIIKKNEVLKKTQPEAFHAAHTSQSPETKKVVSDIRNS
jgi:uncharacterized caspase-like protein